MSLVGESDRKESNYGIIRVILDFIRDNKRILKPDPLSKSHDYGKHGSRNSVSDVHPWT